MKSASAPNAPFFPTVRAFYIYTGELGARKGGKYKHIFKSVLETQQRNTKPEHRRQGVF